MYDLSAHVLDGRLEALDARTGKLCADFGHGGVIDLNKMDNGSVGVFNAFGRVTSGMEAVNAIRQGDTILAISITES